MSQGGNMGEFKSITLRLPDEEYKAFDAICSEKGYSKTGKIREFIRRMIKKEIESVKISAEEWERVKAGIKEIEKGKFVTFEDLKRDFEKRKMGNK
jgi:predicted DNA-binding protein